MAQEEEGNQRVTWRELHQRQENQLYATGLSGVMMAHCKKEVDTYMSCASQTDRKKVDRVCLRQRIAVDDCLEDIPNHFECLQVVADYGECLGAESDEASCEDILGEAVQICFPNADEEVEE